MKEIFMDAVAPSKTEIFYEDLLNLYNKCLDVFNGDNSKIEYKAFAEDFFLSNIGYFLKVNKYFDSVSSFSTTQLSKRIMDLKLYHYTSINSLNSIFETKSFLLSRYDQMNDSKEGTYFLDSIVNKNLKSDDYKKIKDRLDDFYIFSLSTEGDDSAQWERYGDNARGVCIEFDYYSLKSLTCPINVIYLESVKYHLGDELYDKEIASYLNNNTAMNDILLTTVAIDCCCRKHPSFRNEKEMRLIIDKKNLHQVPKCSFIDDFITNNSICSKIKMEYSDIRDRVLIKKIILGPKSNLKADKLQEFIRNKYGLEVPIEKSTSTLQ